MILDPLFILFAPVSSLLTLLFGRSRILLRVLYTMIEEWDVESEENAWLGIEIAVPYSEKSTYSWNIRARQRKLLRFYHRMKLGFLCGHIGAKLLRDITLLQVVPRHYEHSQHLFSGLLLQGGSVTEWLGRWTWNLEIPNSIPTLITSWICFRLAPSSTPLLHSQLICPLSVQILSVLSLFQWFVSLPWKAPELGGEVN